MASEATLRSMVGTAAAVPRKVTVSGMAAR
jgi:hypothetical protein